MGMNWRRLAALTLSLSLLAGGAAVADSLWGNYQGYAKAKVYINDREMQIPDNAVPAFVIDGATVLPLRQTSDSLQAIVKWDNANKTAKLYKPNISMFTARDVKGKDSTVQSPFGKVYRGEKMEFVVFAQVDNLLVDVNGMKISIEDPSGTVVASKETKLDSPGDNFWFTQPFALKFTEKGKYKVKLALDAGSGYVTLEEKLILAE